MWKHASVLFFASVCSSVCVGYDLTKLQMGNECGVTIARGLPAGELIFRADDFRRYSGITCMVVIKLDDASGIREKTLLYFTDFKLDASCEDYVTVVNGDWSVDWRGKPSAGDVVTGLPMQLCGQNKSLEEPDARFVSLDSVFTVIYTRKDSVPWKNGTFVLKFATYHEGECNTDRYYKCSNDRCIPKDIRCHGDIEACGEKDDNCLTADEMEEAVKSFVDYVTDILVDILYLLAIGVALGIISCVYQRCKNSHGDIRNFPIIREILSRIEQRPTSRPQTPESVSLASAHENDVQVNVDGETELNTSCSSSSSISGDIVTSPDDDATSPSAPAYDTLNVDNYMTSREDNTSSPSAPSYDTMNTTSELPPPPSYDQVMSNQEAYGHTGTR